MRSGKAWIAPAECDFQHHAPRAAIFAFVLQSCGNSTQKASSAEADTVKADTPKTIASNLVVNSGGSDFSLVVGHRIHVQEGFVDSDPASGLAMGWAKAVILGRSADIRSSIENAYAAPEYRHYGGTNEDGTKQDEMPTCTIAYQYPIEVDDHDGLNEGNVSSPVVCDLSDGRKIYVTAPSP